MYNASKRNDKQPGVKRGKDMSTIIDEIRNTLILDGVNPLNFSLKPKRSKRKQIDFNKELELDGDFDPFKGFGESMELLGQSLKKGIEIYGGNLQPKQ